MMSWKRFLAAVVLAGGIAGQGAWAFSGATEPSLRSAGQPARQPSPQVVQLVDLDGDGITERLLLGAGGKCVRIISRSLGTFEFPLVAQGLALLSFDWIPGGAPELVIATRRGIVVHALDGRLLEARIGRIDSAALTRVGTAEGRGVPSVMLVSRVSKGAPAEVHLLRPRHAGVWVGALPAESSAAIGDWLGEARFVVYLSGKLRVMSAPVELDGGTPVALRLPAWAI